MATTRNVERKRGRVARGRVAERPTGPVPPVLLFDTNILLDVALARSPWAVAATTLLAQAELGTVRGHVAAHAVTTLYYLVERAHGRRQALEAVRSTLAVLDVVPLSRADFAQALSLGLGDFEDAVQAVAAVRAGADAVITRNARDFRGAPVETRSPEQVLVALGLPGR